MTRQPFLPQKVIRWGWFVFGGDGGILRFALLQLVLWTALLRDKAPPAPMKAILWLLSRGFESLPLQSKKITSLSDWYFLGNS